MYFTLSKAVSHKNFMILSEIRADESLSPEESRAKYESIISGDVIVEVEKKPTLTKGQKAAETRKINKRAKEAKAEVDAEMALAEAKLKEEEE